MSYSTTIDSQTNFRSEEHASTANSATQERGLYGGHYYYHNDTPSGLLWTGIILLITGIAVAAFGVLELILGDIPSGLSEIVVGSVAALAGSSLIAFDVFCMSDV